MQNVTTKNRVEYDPQVEEHFVDCPVCGSRHWGDIDEVAANYHACLAHRREHYNRTGEVWPLTEHRNGIPLEGEADIPFNGEPVSPPPPVSEWVGYGVSR